MMQEGEELRKIQSTLRGIAFDQVKKARTVEEVINTLKALYGEVKTADDLFLDFCSMRPELKELPSEFLCRLWTEMNRIKCESAFSEEDTKKKVYHIFSKGISTLLALELRSQFGYPGGVAPDLADILKAVRRLEKPAEKERKVQAAAACQAATQGDLNERQMEELAERVAKKLKPTVQRANYNMSARKPHGHCFRCGMVGDHYAKDCRNVANPERVAQEEKKWQQRRGTPLNDQGSVDEGNH